MGRGQKKNIEELHNWLSTNLHNVTLMSGQIYQNNKSPMAFDCKKHGGFWNTWNQITQGTHCPKCGKERLNAKVNSRKIPIEEILNRIKKVHNGLITVVNPEIYEHQHSRLKFQCQAGHQWDSKVYNIIQGKGCAKCAGKNITTADFKKTIQENHNGKLHLVEGQEYLGSKTKLFFQCTNQKHKPFAAAPSNVISKKSGCPECKKEKLRGLFAYSTEEVYQSINSRYSNFRPLPNQIYVNQNSTWKFQCDNHEHPIWESRVGRYLLGKIKYGCAYCAGNRPVNNVGDINMLLEELFGSKIKFITQKIPKKIIKNKTNFKFYCFEHKLEFENNLSLISNSKGCPKCSLDSRAMLRRTPIHDLISQVYNKHRDFIKIENSSNYKNSESKILFRCLKKSTHGTFESTVHSVLSGSGCPICNFSKGERNIWNWLKDNEIVFEAQKRVKKQTGNGVFIFDFYLPKHKIIIEYDGRQHSLPIERWGGVEGLKKVQLNDLMKDDYAVLIGFEMIRIPYTEFNQIEQILSDRIKVVTK
jgi:very-short-patch-repair endonuclease